jgi:hypothetical protein
VVAIHATHPHMSTRKPRPTLQAKRHLFTVLLGLMAGCGTSPAVVPDSHSRDASTPDAGGRAPYDYSTGLTNDASVLAACKRYAAAQTSYHSTCSAAVHPEKIDYLNARNELACLVAASQPGVTFDAPKIETCARSIAEREKANCAQRPPTGTSLESPLSVCASTVAGTGTLREGDACIADVQCSSGDCVQGLTINLAGGDSGTVAKGYSDCGTCARVVPLGGECSQATDSLIRCETGAYCKESCVGSKCSSTCVPAPSEGEDCKDRCAQGLLCRRLAERLRCVKAKAAREACTEQNECAPDHSCFSNVCTPFATEGGACRVDGATLPRDTNCSGALACNPQKLTCETVVFGALKAPGETCGRPLVATVECLYDANVCLEPFKYVCPSAPRPEGAACEYANECEGTSLCIDGRCQPLTTGACQQRATVR